MPIGYRVTKFNNYLDYELISYLTTDKIRDIYTNYSLLKDFLIWRGKQKFASLAYKNSSIFIITNAITKQVSVDANYLIDQQRFEV